MAIRKGRQKVPRGPVSDYVAENVSQLRSARGISQQELSRRMGEAGRPMLPSALSKIEGRERGVDVDDLTTLAVALGVNPSRLLLPPEAGERQIALTPALSVPAWAAWQWADAFAPLPAHPESEGYNTDAEIEDFQQHGRPAELRRERRHPLMIAANNVVFSARRVLHHVTKAPDPTRDRSDLGLKTTLRLARRNLARFSSELDVIEEEASDRG